MKYSILGFNQQDVLGITKDVIVEQSNGDYPKTKTLKLDCIDLLILQDVADFMNRRKIIKYTVDDKIYFSIQYSAIIEDLPILGIKKQALSDRLSKLVELEMLEKVVIKNQAGSFVAFRLGEKYESIKYKPSEGEIGTSSTLHLQKYSDTFAEVADYAPKYSSTNNSSTNTKKEEREESLSKKDELFEECWKAYRRKGSKSKSKSYWNKLKDDEKNRVLDHIKAYVSARDINYQQDFERYLRDKTFDSLVIKGNDVLFDPTCATDTAYHPFGNYSILYDDISKQYIYIGYYDGRMSDGYTDDNRPDGATIILNSGRGTIVWSKAEQKWIHKKI